MSAFICTISGKILSINHSNKELSLCIEEALGDEAKEKKKMDFCLDPNVSITNIFNQPTRLVSLKKGQKIKVNYIKDKSKKTVFDIVVLN